MNPCLKIIEPILIETRIKYIIQINIKLKVYFKKYDHKSADYQTVKTTSERRKLLTEKKLFDSIVLSQMIVPRTVVVQKHV